MNFRLNFVANFGRFWSNRGNRISLEKSLIFRFANRRTGNSEFSINAARLVFVETKFSLGFELKIFGFYGKAAAVAIARLINNRTGESYHYKVYKENE